MKLKLIAVALIGLSLAGCGQTEKEAKLETVERVMTPIEQGLYKSFSRHITQNKEAYSSTFAQLYNNRLTISKIRNGYSHNWRSSYVVNLDAPFCNVVQNIRMDEQNIRSIYNNTKLEESLISAKFERLYNQPMETYCVKYKDSDYTQTLPDTTVEVKEKVDIVTVEGDEVLSPELYDKVFEAVTQCKRASNELLEITESKDFLTKSDYSKVMKQVMRCKAFQLEQKLNQN